MVKSDTELEVFWISGSPYSWRVLLSLEIKQLRYRARLLQASQQEHKRPDFLALNPRGHVPVLKDGATVLYESLAIMTYLERKHPKPSLFRETAADSGRVWRQISEFFSYLEGPINRIVLPVYFDKVAGKEDAIRVEAKTVQTELDRWEREIGAAPWLGGDAVSAADVVIYPFVKSLERAVGKPAAAPLKLELLPLAQRYPALTSWMERVERIPGYERTYPPHWRS